MAEMQEEYDTDELLHALKTGEYWDGLFTALASVNEENIARHAEVLKAISDLAKLVHGKEG